MERGLLIEGDKKYSLQAFGIKRIALFIEDGSIVDMDINELKRLLAKLSKSEREKLLNNLDKVSFNFKINKSFLNNGNHPITVPREFYVYMEMNGISKVNDATVIFPDGSTTEGYIYYAVAGYGPYYQIKIRSGSTATGLSKFILGETISVEIESKSSKISINLNNQ